MNDDTNFGTLIDSEEMSIADSTLKLNLRKRMDMLGIEIDKTIAEIDELQRLLEKIQSQIKTSPPNNAKQFLELHKTKDEYDFRLKSASERRIQLLAEFNALAQKIESISQDEEPESNDFPVETWVTNVIQAARDAGFQTGAFEEQIGCSRGYLSRLKKSGKPPAVGIVYKASQILGIDINILADSQFTSAKGNDLKNINFIGMLKRDTVNSKIMWR